MDQDNCTKINFVQRQHIRIDGLLDDMEFHHPCPFDEFEELNKTAWRKDSPERYKKIKDSYGNFSGKTLIDIGCANGYFLFQFIRDGGLSAYGVDTNQGYLTFIKYVSDRLCQQVKVSTFLPEQKFDICLFLDLFHKDNESVIHYPKFIGRNCDVAYVSGTNNSGYKDDDLIMAMSPYFKNIDFIHEGFMGRKIFKCSNKYE
jgi:SAM-dependent methyltransferase